MLLEHNLKSYQEVTALLDSGANHVCIYQATGTGKSYLAIELLTTRFRELRVLYVVPKLIIADSIAEYPEWPDGISVSTYSALSMYSLDKLQELINDYDVFFFDEVHHIDAAVWGVACKVIMESNCYVIGMTATAIRPSNGVDICAKYFPDTTVRGLTQAEAVLSGVLSQFKYLCVLGSIQPYLVHLSNNADVGNVRKRILDTHLNVYSNADIAASIRKHWTNDSNKWLYFGSSVDGLKSISSTLIEWLGPVLVFSVVGTDSRECRKRTIANFVSCPCPCVLTSVDVLNEGLHLDCNVNLILDRLTGSRTVFEQQLGRALRANHKGFIPLIVDVVGNYKNLEVHTTVARTALSGVTKLSPALTELGELIVVDTYLLTLQELFKTINEHPKWTDEDDNILRLWYSREGIKVAIRFPDKSEQEVRKRIKELGLKKNVTWSAEEDDLIRKYFPTMGSGVEVYLPLRAAPTCVRRAKELGVRPVGYWSPSDDYALLTLYKHGEFDDTTVVGKHNNVDCCTRLNKMGVIQ